MNAYEILFEQNMCKLENRALSSNIRLKRIMCGSLCFWDVVQYHWMRGALHFKTM